MATTFVKQIVSKKKRRFEYGKFDLDLSYITDRIIAMGFPSENFEALYRNNMKDVQRFLNQLHKGHYKVYNLCTERKYDHKKFYGRVAEFEFDDHNPPPFRLIHEFCLDVAAYHDADPQSVAVVHCKAGKGRTGTMVCAYLLYSKQCRNTNEALNFFGNKRTTNGKGVTIPSQRRYVGYYHDALNNANFNPETIYSFPRPPCRLRQIVMHTVPNFNHGGGCDPVLSISQGERTLFVCKPKSPPVDNKVVFDCHNVLLNQDVRITFYHKTTKTKMCSVTFNTMFIRRRRWVVKKIDIDKACKDKENKHFDPSFKIEFVFAEVADSNRKTVSSGLSTTQFMPNEEKISAEELTARHHEAQQAHQQLSKCGGCENTIGEFEACLVSGGVSFHWNCLKCGVCSRGLEGVADCVMDERTGKFICTACVERAARGKKAIAKKYGVSSGRISTPATTTTTAAGGGSSSSGDGTATSHTAGDAHVAVEVGPEEDLTDETLLAIGSALGGFFKECAACGLLIKDDFYDEIGEKQWHSTCFKCHQCHRLLSGAPLVETADGIKCAPCPMDADVAAAAAAAKKEKPAAEKKAVVDAAVASWAPVTRGCRRLNEEYQLFIGLVDAHAGPKGDKAAVLAAAADVAQLIKSVKESAAATNAKHANADAANHAAKLADATAPLIASTRTYSISSGDDVAASSALVKRSVALLQAHTDQLATSLPDGGGGSSSGSGGSSCSSSTTATTTIIISIIKKTKGDNSSSICSSIHLYLPNTTSRARG